LKSQEVETNLSLESTLIVQREKSRSFTEKFTEWFRNFLENSE